MKETIIEAISDELILETKKHIQSGRIKDVLKKADKDGGHVKIHLYYLTIEHYEKLENYDAALPLMKELYAFKKVYLAELKTKKLAELRRKFELREKEALLKQQAKFRKVLRAKNEELAIALDRQNFLELHTQSLQMQLSPHFIFNSLQSIQSSIYRKEALKASDLLAQFARLMRSILKSSTGSKVSLKEELNLLEDYLELEQERFPKSFTYRIELQNISNAEEVYIPSLLLKSFVENALVHGLANKLDGEIVLIFRLQKGVLYAHIIDNGIGQKLAGLFKERDTKDGPKSLKLLEERTKLSQKIEPLNFNFRLFDRCGIADVQGTHALVRMENIRTKKNKVYDKNIFS